jgi:hypothetical protein
MPDLVIGIARNIVRHIAIQLLESGDISRIAGVRPVVMVYRATQFVVLLP